MPLSHTFKSSSYSKLNCENCLMSALVFRVKHPVRNKQQAVCYCSALKFQTLYSSETSANLYQTAWHLSSYHDFCMVSMNSFCGVRSFSTFIAGFSCIRFLAGGICTWGCFFVRRIASKAIMAATSRPACLPRQMGSAFVSSCRCSA
jgi:hypothetical protein